MIPHRLQELLWRKSLQNNKLASLEQTTAHHNKLSVNVKKWKDRRHHRLLRHDKQFREVHDARISDLAAMGDHHSLGDPSSAT